ncbi:MAG: ATP-binding cassette domain-containing protein [Methanobacteriota archaeon]|nr:MAG: ATP-binding cassette domain-containing protein [Euryarchaeota archaeon]
MLEVEDLTVRYRGRSKPAVRSLSFETKDREFILLAGNSASGKSTAMQVVCGFIPHIIPAEVDGAVRLDGKEYSDPAEVAGVACMVQQDPETQFCTETVEEEVAFGPENLRYPRGEIASSVDHALAAVKASHLIDRRLSTLSGGEKQKVAIASVLSVNPRLLILDEPTASLDPRSVGQVVRAIRAAKAVRDITVIVVEHRVRDFIDMSDRLITLAEGKLELDCRRGEAEFLVARARALAPLKYRRPVLEMGQAAISVRGLSLEMEGWQILDGVDLDIREGAVVALMGENGSGKTTLLRHFVGLQPVQKGTISICGHTVSSARNVDPWDIGRDVGLVFQNPNHQLFENTVEREMLFASTNFLTKTSAAREALDNFERQEGLQRYVHPHRLSFGQKRRVNILSAYSHEPKVLLLDEPFAGQDQDNQERIVTVISDIQRSGRTIVVVTHDLDFAKQYCTDALVLNEGRVVASGPVDAIPETVWKSLSAEGRG